MNGMRPLIGITMGDPASIGPEIVARSVADPAVQKACRPLVIGDAAILRRAATVCGLSLAVSPVSDPAAGAYRPGTADVLDVTGLDPDRLAWGKVQPEAGRASAAYVEKAIELALARRVEAVATAPVNKEAWRAAGVPYIGHTEMFGERCGNPDPLTMFEVRGLRIFFLTRHVSLAAACAMIRRERVLDYLHRCEEALRRLGVGAPRIAVAGLNPHAGEHGLFGDEEEREIGPAVAEARAAGIDAHGPLPADSVFHFAAKGQYDAVLALYHDQGHIAAKMYDFERTVSVTNGLPFLRTSVDHGTAFDIAGTGKASAVSMKEAILAAARYAPLFR
jgi:4-phospho-D-threonate 3-dehydrogenase / 4-phospho-D-erythronate 3-dehydrogenase